MKNLKRLVSMVLSWCIILSTSAFATNSSEKVNVEDMKNYYPFNKWAAEIGIKYSLIFLENNTRDTQRIEIASIVASLLEDNATSDENDTNFTDLSDIERKNKKSIELVASKNIVNGYDDGTFKPFNSVTRAEFVTMLDRANFVNSANNTSSISFDDITNHWSKESILKIASNGIVNGKEKNKFCPDDTITPQEIFVILDRLVSNGSITKDELLNAMLNTFKCKVYNEKEKFIAEEIYGKFDEVQGNIKCTWPYDMCYTVDNGTELITYNDFLCLIGYFRYHNAVIKRTEEETAKYNEILENVKKGLGISDLNQTMTLRELYRAIYYACISLEPWTFDITSDKEVDLIHSYFTNMNELSYEEKAGLFFVMSNYEGIVYNSQVYLPLDANVTKVILNWHMIGLKENVTSVSFKEYCVNDDDEIETDIEKLPYNYMDYPFIIKGIPKEVYERPYAYTRENPYMRDYTAKEVYINSRFFTESTVAAKNVDMYYNMMLNVDYRTIDATKFFYKALDCLIGMSEEDVNQYVNWVKENEIILKGTAKSLPGTVVIDELFTTIRIMFDFEIVSAKQNLNILFGDILYSGTEDILYEKNKYNFVIDLPIEGRYILSSNRVVRYGQHGATFYPIYEFIDTHKRRLNEDYCINPIPKK